MLSAPVSDSWEGPKRQGATGDAIFGNNFFPSYPLTPPFSTLHEGGVRKLFSGNRFDSCAALAHIASGGAGMPNPSRSGACAAVEALRIVHDVRYVTCVKSRTQRHENRMTIGGGRVRQWYVHA